MFQQLQYYGLEAHKRCDKPLIDPLSRKYLPNTVPDLIEHLDIHIQYSISVSPDQLAQVQQNTTKKDPGFQALISFLSFSFIAIQYGHSLTTGFCLKCYIFGEFTLRIFLWFDTWCQLFFIYLLFMFTFYLLFICFCFTSVFFYEPEGNPLMKVNYTYSVYHNLLQ